MTEHVPTPASASAAGSSGADASKTGPDTEGTAAEPWMVSQEGHVTRAETSASVPPIPPVPPFSPGIPCPGPAAGAGAFGTPAVAPVGPGASGTTPATPRRRYGIGAMFGAAALAAVLACAGTFGVMQLGTPTSSVAAASSPVVVQASASDPNWTSVAAAARQSVVSITVPQGQGASLGSGVVWNSDGMIVTNAHVVAGATSQGGIQVQAGGNLYAATLVGSDTATDLAVIQIEDAPSDLVPLTRGDSSAVEVGDDVMAIGSPLGLDDTVTTGIVSALGRPVTTGQTADTAVVTSAIQTSAPLNPGNSGGALVNAAGELVGINSAIASVSSASSTSSSSQSGDIGIGFAIPVSEAERVVESLITTGSVEHSYLGASVADGTASTADGEVLGAAIGSVEQGGPGAAGGLQQGDVVTAVDGQRVTSAVGLIAEIRATAPGDTVTLTVVRDGASRELTVTPTAIMTSGSGS